MDLLVVKYALTHALEHLWFMGLLCYLLVTVPVLGIMFIHPQQK
jgi:hypothetical protein